MDFSSTAQQRAPALPRAALSAASSSGSVPYVPPPSGLAAAQAVAQRLSQNFAERSTAGAVQPSEPVPLPGPEPAEGDGESLCDAAVPMEVSRNGYTFGKKYNRAHHVRIPDTQGLQSIDRYENLGLVGRGAFNKIYKARHRETGEVVALKAMQLAALEQSGHVQGDEGMALEMMREMSILLSIRHPNIVTVHEVVMDPTQMFLVMELVDFDLGLLLEHMKQPFSEAQVKCLAMQLLSALSAVHDCFVLHRCAPPDSFALVMHAAHTCLVCCWSRQGSEANQPATGQEWCPQALRLRPGAAVLWLRQSLHAERHLPVVSSARDPARRDGLRLGRRHVVIWLHFCRVAPARRASRPGHR